MRQVAVFQPRGGPTLLVHLLGGMLTPCDPSGIPSTLIVAEVLVPAWAERHGGTPWHPGHIAERYGLMTIIVLGESILAATIAVRTATAEAGLTPAMVELVAGGLLIVFSMWWYYFYRAAVG